MSSAITAVLSTYARDLQRPLMWRKTFIYFVMPAFPTAGIKRCTNHIAPRLKRLTALPTQTLLHSLEGADFHSGGCWF